MKGNGLDCPCWAIMIKLSHYARLKVGLYTSTALSMPPAKSLHLHHMHCCAASQMQLAKSIAACNVVSEQAAFDVLQGIHCNLITGQERQMLAGARHVSCTIEMVSTTKQWDCAVIDEIQVSSQSTSMVRLTCNGVLLSMVVLEFLVAMACGRSMAGQARTEL